MQTILSTGPLHYLISNAIFIHLRLLQYLYLYAIFIPLVGCSICICIFFPRPLVKRAVVNTWQFSFFFSSIFSHLKVVPGSVQLYRGVVYRAACQNNIPHKKWGVLSATPFIQKFEFRALKRVFLSATLPLKFFYFLIEGVFWE